MNKWEYLNVSISINASGNFDFFVKKDSEGFSSSTPEEIDAYYNVSKSELDGHLIRLMDDGWNLVTRNKGSDEELLTFQRKLNS